MIDYTHAYFFARRPPENRASFRRLAGQNGPLGPLSAALFLTYQPGVEGEMGVWPFLNVTLPRLLPQLARSAEIERVEMNARVRGRVEWTATYKARYLADSNPSLYVCRESRRRFDEPENQLLKYCLVQLQACLETVPPALHDWLAWRLEGAARRPQPVADLLRQVAARLRTYRTNVYLSEVQLPKAISSLHLSAARTSKNELYGDVIALFELYRQVAEAESWERWAELLYRTGPLPAGFNDGLRGLLFEEA